MDRRSQFEPLSVDPIACAASEFAEVANAARLAVFSIPLPQSRQRWTVRARPWGSDNPQEFLIMPGKQAKVVTPLMLRCMLRYAARSPFPKRGRANDGEGAQGHEDLRLP